jgi:ribosomal protein L29
MKYSDILKKTSSERMNFLKQSKNKLESLRFLNLNKFSKKNFKKDILETKLEISRIYTAINMKKNGNGEK